MAAAATIQIGEAKVDFSTLAIEGPAGRFSMEPKVMSLLQVLVDNAGGVVSRADLLDQVWGENTGGDESLSRGISLLRRAFGEARGDNQYIETVPKRGYLLAARISANVGDSANKPGTANSTPTSTDVTPSIAIEQTAISSQSTRRRASPGRLAIVFGTGIFIAVLAYLGFHTEQAQNTVINAPAATINITSQALLTQQSIAVLPFDDLSEAGDQQYLADGLAEEILNALVGFPELRVMGRKSSFSFEDPTHNIDRINSTLAVNHVLIGSLRKQGSQIRVTARLMDTQNGTNVWSNNYDGDISDIFDLQEEIARQIAKSLGVVLALSTKERFAPRLTNDRQAYDLFLQGRSLTRKFGHRNKSKAKDLLGQAVSLDPGFAAAWAWLGQANLFLTLTAPSKQIPGLIATARNAVNTSLTIDPDLAMGHYVQSILFDYDLDFAASMGAAEKAYTLNPSQPFLAIRWGNYHNIIGRSAHGSEIMEQGLLWDPTDSVGLLNLSTAMLGMGRFERAASLLRRSDDLGFVPAAGQRCMVLKDQGLAQDAYQCWELLQDDFRQRYNPVFQSEEYWLILGRAIFLDDSIAQQTATAMLDNYFSSPDSRANNYLTQVYLFVGGPVRFMQVFVSHPFPLNSGALSLIWGDNKRYRELRQHPEFPAFAEQIGLIRAWQRYGWPDHCRLHKDIEAPAVTFSCD